MKVYISADIEGVAGITTWSEATASESDSKRFQRQMTDEVVAACQGAIASGATEIIIKDAHDTGRNIDPAELPERARIIRGWSGHPYCMMQELDETFDAAIMIGYHSRAGSGGNPLAHSFSSSKVYEMRLNSEPVSEFHVNTTTAMMQGVPLVFVSGDSALCSEVKEFNERIETVETSRGVGQSTISIHPKLATKLISEGVAKSLKTDLQGFNPQLEANYQIEIDFKEPQTAYASSFYPGAALVDERTVRFETTDYFEILRMIIFTV